jgi:prepilin-type processing-associated H-X9-DG protein
MKSSNTKAFTMPELLVVLLIVIVLAALILVRLAQPKSAALRIQCVNNLNQLGHAFRIWQQDNGQYPMSSSQADFDASKFASDNQMYKFFQVLSNELASPRLVFCPTDKQRSAATNFSKDFDSSHVSYFAGLDLNETNSTAFLAGDRNLVNGMKSTNGVFEVTSNQTLGWGKKMHFGNGDILFVDGHVDQLDSAQLRNAVANTGLATNRLVFP